MKPNFLTADGFPTVGTTVTSALASDTRALTMSNTSEDSQTAAEFLRDQLQLEAEAREVLPYSIDTCSNHLGPLRQNVFACLTCNPTGEGPMAGVCYACSVQCHGEHNLVEIFQKRKFTCDCGTTRFPGASAAPCMLRVDSATRQRGVNGQQADARNRYNQNFANRFCCCSRDYDPFAQKGTMFQCLGLGTIADGGCGEDWYHPGCLAGDGSACTGGVTAKIGQLTTIAEEGAALDDEAVDEADVDEESDGGEPLPPGFPPDDAFETFLCYKCVEAFPWIKRYAGTTGFLPLCVKEDRTEGATSEAETTVKVTNSQKHKLGNEMDNAEGGMRTNTEMDEGAPAKRLRTEPGDSKAPSYNAAEPSREANCKLSSLPPEATGSYSIFLRHDFREHLCRCADCLGRLIAHPQLLEPEDVYEPPLSSENGGDGGSTQGSGSLLERGESALRNMDRVQAIEGVMAYNHLKERLRPFFQQFAESGRPVGADDIKEYFAKLRGDDEAIRSAAGLAAAAGGGGNDRDADGDSRREQGGY